MQRASGWTANMTMFELGGRIHNQMAVRRTGPLGGWPSRRLGDMPDALSRLMVGVGGDEDLVTKRARTMKENEQ